MDKFVVIVGEIPMPIESRLNDRFQFLYRPEPNSVAVYIDGVRIRKEHQHVEDDVLILRPELGLKDGQWLCVDYIHVPNP